MAAHPEMKAFAAANVETVAAETSQKVGVLVTRLLTDSCVSQVRDVAKIGQSSAAIKAAFSALGELAVQELMADKTVQSTMGLFANYIDQTRISEILRSK